MNEITPDLRNALLKKALGYDKQEIHEEYARNADGEMQLVKRRITSKHHSPDPIAAKLLISGGEDSDETQPDTLTFLSFHELAEEKENLTEELKKEQEQQK